MTFGVDGLVSGLDTTTIISQLMQLEAQPQTRLKTDLSTAKVAVSAWQTVNTRMLAISAAADKLQKASVWSPTKATASNDAVTVTTGDAASVGSLTFSVQNLATAKSVASQELTSRTDPASITGTPIEIHNSDGSLRATITPTDGSLDAVAAAINNSADAGVRAAVVQVSSGVYRLQLTSKTTGTAGDFQVTGSGGAALGGVSFTDITTAQDAVVHVGPVGGGYDVTSSSNTIEDLLPGVTMQLNKTTAAVTVDVTADPSSTVDAVQALVDAVNGALGEISDRSSVGVANSDGTRTGQGALTGSGLLRDLSSGIVRAATDLVGSSTASTYGLSINKDGTLTLDKDKLKAALDADPAAVQAVFAPTASGAVGIASRLKDVATTATKSDTGLISLAIAGQNSLIKDLDTRISDWDTRLALKKESLQRTYTALEVSLSQLKSQSSWLAGQLSGLASSSAANGG